MKLKELGNRVPALFSTKQKVYTTDDAPLIKSENVGVEGKRYPTHKLGRCISEHPILMLVTLWVPLAFFVIGCIYIYPETSYSLDDYQIQSTIPVRRDALKIGQVLDEWATTLSGVSLLSDSVDRLHERAYVQDTVELRAEINVKAVYESFASGELSSNMRDSYSNMISTLMLPMYASAEQMLTTLDGYEDVCFTNDLRDGVVNNVYPTCAPVSSVTQYYYPVWNGLEWYMNGSGTGLQVDVLQRIFSNPNYGWFFDSNFSSLNTQALKLRSQFTFATSRRTSRRDYLARMAKYLPQAFEYIRDSTNLYYARLYLGGGTSQSILLEIAGNKESYKVGVAAVIMLAFSWWHCRTFIVGLYTVLQTFFVYMAAAGLYALIYKTLPLTTYSAIIWVTTFCMHGTLSFYDMFVYSGIMATKGRQNNLSVAQRVCFTIRRVSVGVWIADVLAIVIFAINTTSLFSSVVQFSVFMMIALLWNMYCIVLTTPALVVFHHMYFSNKRRNLQKQNDVLNAAMESCRRSRHLVTVLGAVQENVSEGERPYYMNEDVLNQRIGANRGIHKRHFTGIKDFVRQEAAAGYDKIRAARRDAVGAFHKVRKTKQELVEGGAGEQGVELPAIALQDFLQVGDANPLADDDGAGGASGQRMYYNPRMVFPSDLIHIPAAYVERSEECWAGLCSALGEATQNEHGDAAPPRVEGLDGHDWNEVAAAAFSERWREVGTRLGVETTSNNRTASLVPVAVRNVVCAQDPSMVVDTVVRKATLNPEDDAAAPFGASYNQPTGAARVTGGPSGFGLAKLRYRWAHRGEGQRTCCCGMFGKVSNENADERMRRLMRRKVKRDGFTFFERMLLSYFLPAIYCARYVFVALLLALFVALAIASSFIPAGGLPNTLTVGQEEMANTFAAMDDSFGQRGNCTFCGPYYRSVQDYRQATATDIAVCTAAGWVNQMNLYSDLCGVCNGTNACVDCAGTPNGDATLDACGGCSVAGTGSAAQCTCGTTRDCSYCEWAAADGFLASPCAAVCPSESTCGATGQCNPYTAECDCAVGFSGATCAVVSIDCGPHGTANAAGNACECDTGWSGETCSVSSQCGGRGRLLSAAESPTGAEMCACVGHWRGPTCQVCDCMNGGMCDSVTGECACVGAFGGPRCETCAASCTLHGTCPDTTTPDYTAWNVRTCIADACVTTDATTGLKSFTETMCAACERLGTTASPTACSMIAAEATCMANAECWWYTDATPAGGYCGLARVNNATSSVSCTCANPRVWSGESCATCLAPTGATCQDDGTVLGCNGLTYTTARTAMSRDVCGVCGGNGLCRGCDGIPSSGKVFDACGVCGGNGNCTGVSTAQPVYVDYLFDLTSVPQILLNAGWCQFIATVGAALRGAGVVGTQTRTIIEDYLDDSSDYYLTSLVDFYNYANANGRLSEVVFTVNYNMVPYGLQYIRYRTQTNEIDSESSAEETVNYYYWLEKYFVGSYRAYAESNGVSLSYTSSVFQPAIAKVGALQSLWFAVGIGLAATFVFLLVYYVSITMAAAATMVAGIVCFGSLTVCMIFGWEVDAVLQVCISCTIPIGVEYVVHFCSGYFDYLQTTTSHLFAKDVTRKTAMKGSLVRSVPAVCTSAVTVILISIMFDVSSLTPWKRCGQVSITLHLLVLLAGVCFVGTIAALGPMKIYQHWTISSVICFACALLAGIAVLIMYGANGVLGPHANRILQH